MNKLNRMRTILLTLIGAFAALAAVLVFVLLPTSEIANGIQYSGQDAIWVLAIAPIASIISTLSFVFAYQKDYKIWCDLLSKPVVTGARGLFAVLNIFNLAVYLTYFTKQISLGFVAPYDGTGYEYLAVVAIVIVVIMFLLTALSSIAVIRNK